MAYVALGLALLAIFAGNFASGMFRGLLVIAIILYTVQGVALTHAMVRARGASAAWLVAVYAGILVIPPGAILGQARRLTETG